MSSRRAVLAIVAFLSVGGALFLLVTAPKRDAPTTIVPVTPEVTRSNPQRLLASPTDSSPAQSAELNQTVALPAATSEYSNRAAELVHTTRLMTDLPPADLDTSGVPPEVVMENIRMVFRQFSSRFNANPVGNNAEITAALNGGNLRQVRFLKAEDGLRINREGELVDSWGTPFFFHQLSGTEMEIHSAGPDRVMWTADDLVTK